MFQSSNGPSIQRSLYLSRCQTTFWFGRRKHHCRNCGNLVCGDCSSNSLPLPSEQLYHPVRICDACFSKRKSVDEGEEKEATPDANDDDDVKVEGAAAAVEPSSD